jgi:hypothetical protein
MGFAPVGEVNEAASMAEQGRRHRPPPLAISKTHELRAGDALRSVVGLWIGQPLRRRGVADGEADVDALDVVSKQCAGGAVGKKNTAIADDQQRLVDRLEKFGGIGEGRQSRRLDRLLGRAVAAAGGSSECD